MEYSEFKQKTSYVGEPDISGSYAASDYMTWAYEGFVELIRGKIYKMAAAPSTKHQRVARNLSALFAKHFSGNSCEYFFAPFDVFLVHPGEDFKQTKNVVEPDFCVICDKEKIHQKGCIGAPDLVVEISSISTRKRDLKDKYALYEEYGVKEYWMILPYDETIIVHVLKDGKFVSMRPQTKGEMLTSVIFPFLTVNLDTVFPDTESEN